jgi:glycosyltransferase involved in cell wall biosynthesis
MTIQDEANQEESRSGPVGCHIVFDMTYPWRLKTGTTVYANAIIAALRKGYLHRVTSLSAPNPVKRGGIWKIWNGLSTLLWIQLVLPIELLWLKADILHAPSYFAPLLCPCPLIVTVHDTLYLTQPHHYKDKFFSLYSKLFIGAAVRRADIICTVSAFSKKEIESSYRIESDRIRVTYPGVSSGYRPQSEEQLASVRDKYKLERPYFLFVGAWEPRKNLPHLISAFRIFCNDQTRDYELILVGPQGSGAAEVNALLGDPELEGRVRPMGFVPDEDMPAMYAAAEAFVLPSLGEGFGIPIIEAMACGTPVLASNTTCLPEVAGDAAVYFDPKDPSNIARAMSVILQPAIQEEMKLKGLSRARMFTWENCARETEQAYADALKESTEHF